MRSVQHTFPVAKAPLISPHEQIFQVLAEFLQAMKIRNTLFINILAASSSLAAYITYLTEFMQIFLSALGTLFERTNSQFHTADMT
jgi:hypothetical protein